MDTFLNPYLYVAFMFVIWHGFRLRAWHRRFFGISLFSPGSLVTRRIVSALVVGAAVSAVMLLFDWDAGIKAVHGWWLGTVAVVLGLFRVRWMGFSYVAGATSVLALVCQRIDLTAVPSAIKSVLLSLQTLDVQNLLMFTAVLTVLGGLLTVWEAGRSYCPVLMPHRGKHVGAVMLQSLWDVPVVVQTGSSWFVLPVPLVYSDFAVARTKEQRARFTGSMTAVFGATLALVSIMPFTFNADIWLWIGALWALFGQEGVTRLSRRQEVSGTPVFRMREDGIRVLAVKAGSPAEEMGIRPGEVITRANGQAVYNATDLYAALQQSPAFCKLEVVDGDNERRIVQRSLYADEPHQLGLVPVEGSPRGEAPSLHRYGWWTLFTDRTSYRGSEVKKGLEG